VDHAEYCRQLEAYLCRKNGGHLVRIVGPAFELVRGWASAGVPLKIACGGIDRYCERQTARTRSGTRRRPVRIEFCEADILALYDDWRRAVGVPAGAGTDGAPAAPRRSSLAEHLERVVSRLIGRRAARSPVFEARIEALLAALDPLTQAAKGSRGEARAAIVDRLDALDRDLLDAALADLDQATAASLAREAEEELAAFGSRMTAEARSRAVEAAYQRLVRESLGLPIIRYG
jgi:hypothetical protein